MIKNVLFLLFYSSLVCAEPIIVSVVDQGILNLNYLENYIDRNSSYDFNINDKSQSVDYAFNIDKEPHGTFIAFKIAFNNNIKLLDVVYEHNIQNEFFSYFADSSLALYRRKLYYKTQTEKILDAWSYSVSKGAKVINFSSGSSFFDYNLIKNWLIDHPNIFVIVSAGNDSYNLDKYPHYPCSIEAFNLICVGSVNRYKKISDFSNYGKNIVYAFGEHKNYQGTSFATPEVSKYVALLLSQNIRRTTIRNKVFQKFN